MALRKAAAYSKKSRRPYTRKSKKKSKSYIRTIPGHKIVKFSMGKQNKFDKGDFPFKVMLQSKEKILIRDNALEAIRQLVHKKMEKEYPGNFYFEVKVYPHHILRENKVLTGAGADRMQTGMQKSFGTIVGRAARVKKNQTIAFVAVSNQKAARYARNQLTKVKSKVPCSTRIINEKLNK